MFRASSCPSSGATTTEVSASGLPSELGDSSAVGRGRAGPARPRPTALFIFISIFFFPFFPSFKILKDETFRKPALVRSSKEETNLT